MPPPSQLEIEELIRDFQRFLAPTLPQLKNQPSFGSKSEKQATDEPMKGRS